MYFDMQIRSYVSYLLYTIFIGHTSTCAMYEFVLYECVEVIVFKVRKRIFFAVIGFTTGSVS